MQKNVRQEISRLCCGVVQEDQMLARHTTWGIGGPADLFASPESREELRCLVEWCTAHQVPFMVIGRGSNLLVSDAGFRGVVISLCQVPYRVTISDSRVTAGAGTGLPELERAALEAGLSGFECLCGIPGSVGGSLVTNAGAAGRAMGDCVADVVMLQKNGTFARISRSELAFAYRSASVRQHGIVWEATFQLAPRPPAEIKAAIRTAMRRRMATQPLGEKTAGSVFKNPAGDFAGRLIESCGCQGWSQGDAMVSLKHANFIINKNRARAGDVLTLMERIKNQVAGQTGITLEPEVEFVK